jgi:hypothetical protein
MVNIHRVQISLTDHDYAADHADRRQAKKSKGKTSERENMQVRIGATPDPCPQSNYPILRDSVRLLQSYIYYIVLLINNWLYSAYVLAHNCGCTNGVAPV